MTNKTEDKYHGIEFHHFHNDDADPREIMPGSISMSYFSDLTKKLLKTYCVNDPKTWSEKALENKLKPTDICYTFDDNILSQYTVAKRVLDYFNIKAFFFIYTAMLHDQLPRLEIYRYFVKKYYRDFDDFFDEFFRCCLEQTEINAQMILATFPEDYLKQYSCYSRNERIYRYFRDKVLGNLPYTRIMDNLVSRKTSIKKLANEGLWVDTRQIRHLAEEGHYIGLHSVNHLTDMGEKTDHEQKKEYEQNKSDLEKITGQPVTSVSYPSGSYNKYTLSLMEELGITIGFKTEMTPGYHTVLDAPRKDSSVL